MGSTAQRLEARESLAGEMPGEIRRRHLAAEGCGLA